MANIDISEPVQTYIRRLNIYKEYYKETKNSNIVNYYLFLVKVLPDCLVNGVMSIWN